jgi:hypothetical protein
MLSAGLVYVIASLPETIGAFPPQLLTGVETKYSPDGRVSVKFTFWERLPGTLVMVNVTVAGVPIITDVGLKDFASVGDNTCTFAAAVREFPTPE